MRNAERFVRSIKEERLDRLIPIGERHFRCVNHQGIGNRLISAASVIQMTTCVHVGRRLGGLFNFYQRAA